MVIFLLIKETIIGYYLFVTIGKSIHFWDKVCQPSGTKKHGILESKMNDNRKLSFVFSTTTK